MPYSGWELALRGLLGDDDHAADVLADWGLAGIASEAWDAYSDPPIGRLIQRWGAPGDTGVETDSVEGAALMAMHAANVARRKAIEATLVAFGATVQEMPGPRRGGPDTTATEACLAAALAPDTLAAAVTQAMAMEMFWADQTFAWEMTRTVGAAMCIELHNAIVQRGGKFADISEILRHVGADRTAPFASLKHALAFSWGGQHGSTVLGAGSPLAGMIGGAVATHRLPSGVRFGEVTVVASHVSSGSARNVGTLHVLEDVSGALAAARVGGEWIVPDATKPNAKVCIGGRPIKLWEKVFLEYTMLGAEVDKRTFRCLTLPEAVDRIRQEFAAVATGRAARVNAWLVAPGDMEGRHVTNEQARASAAKVRRAMTDALVAWGMIEPRTPIEQAATMSDRGAIPPAARAHALWDPEAL
jgi:hypothetical protein